MYLRSASKQSPNKLNTSRGRGKRPSTPSQSLLNTIDTTARRPLVVHSPPGSSTIQSSKSILDEPVPQFVKSFLQTAEDTDSSSTSSRSHIVNSDNSNSNLGHKLDNSISPTSTLLGFDVSNTITSIGPIMNLAPRNDKTSNQGAGEQEMSLNSLLSVLTSIRDDQRSLSAELGSLKATVADLSQRPPDSNMAAGPSNQSNQEPTDPIQAFLASQSTNRQKLDLEKWKINFDGSGNVDDFIFKLDTLVERTRCTHEQLESRFQIFLSGKAEKWYWEFVKRNNDPPYRLIKNGLLQEFAVVETDDQLLLQLNSRKQQPRESYDDFHTALLAISYKMKEPMSEERLVNIIKKNVSTELKFMLFNSETTDLHALREVARKAETIIKETKQTHPIKNLNRQVHELELESLQGDGLGSEEDPQIEALQFSARAKKSDYSHIKCWNCLSFGHSYLYCPEDTRNLFCYKCGERGVATVRCKNPHPGNWKRNELATGDTRSPQSPPSST